MTPPPPPCSLLPLVSRSLALSFVPPHLFNKGMTLEDYEEMKRRKPAGKRSPDVTEETRKKISTRLKEKWRDPAYRASRKLQLPNRRGIPHTEETKARISAAVKKKWDDPAYREKVGVSGELLL